MILLAWMGQLQDLVLLINTPGFANLDEIFGKDVIHELSRGSHFWIQ
jgi:hypothetical protein